MARTMRKSNASMAAGSAPAAPKAPGVGRGAKFDSTSSPTLVVNTHRFIDSNLGYAPVPKTAGSGLAVANNGTGGR